MAVVTLDRADLALFSDPASTRVVIPRLTGMPQRRGRAGTTVRFEGDTDPTAFRGEGRTRTYDLTCRYAPDEHEQMAVLLELIDEVAPAAVDHRLLLRTHVGLVARLDPAVAVEVFDVNVTPGGAGLFDVQFTAQVVQHTFAVA